MLRPYPGRYLPGKLFLITMRNFILFLSIEDQAVFNYRLSRAQRIIENTFGILASRWRIFGQSIIANRNRVEMFTQAAIVLHKSL